MRRLGRYILNGLTVLSLVLCVSLAGLWLRSYSTPGDWLRLRLRDVPARSRLYDRGRWQTEVEHHFLELIFSRGRVSVAFTRYPERFDGGKRLGFSNSDHGALALWTAQGTAGTWHRWGIEAAWREWNAPGFLYAIRWQVIFPHWMLLVPFAALPALRLLLRRFLTRDVPHQRNRCRRCGYDLRATPDRCPECGTIPTKVKA